MVYIRLNTAILPLLPSSLPKQFTVLTIQSLKYMQYKDFKLLCKTSSSPLHQYVTKSDIISEIQIQRLIELSKRTPQQRKLIQQLKNKHEFRLMNSDIVKKGNDANNVVYYYGTAGQNQNGNTVRELTDSISFGVTFIFSFFMAGITGYFFAQYFFHFQLTGCLMVSVVFIFATIFVETWLYIIKQSKANQKIKLQRKMWQKDQSAKAEYTLKEKKVTNLSFKKQLSQSSKLKKE